MENPKEISTDRNDLVLTSVEIDDLSTKQSDDDGTHSYLNSVPENKSVETSHSLDENSMSRLRHEKEAKREVGIIPDILNQGHQLGANSEQNTIENQPAMTSKSDLGATMRYVPPHLRNRQKTALDMDRNIVKNKYIQPIGSSSTMSRHVSTNYRNQETNRIRRDAAGGQHTGTYVRRRNNLSFEYLDDLLKLDAEEFILRISGDMHGLNYFLDKSNSSDDTYVLAIRVLKRIFDSRSNELQPIVVETILNERFVDNLQKYLGCLPMHDEGQKSQNAYFWKNIDAFWSDLIAVLRKALELLPTHSSIILPKVILGLQICIPLFELHQNQLVAADDKIKLDELVKILQMNRSQVEDDNVFVKPKKQFKFDTDEPPDDFRAISVFPLASEILGKRSFLRPNVIDGPYRDVDHYLDVQYRLLREDFVNPLRCGVRSILSGENIRHENVRVHGRIRFLHREAVNENYCVRLKFDFTRRILISLDENSKRFMFGSLVCFTRDNFATLKFARVVKRDITDLIRGELIVGFETAELDLSFDHDYLMIECTVYYEPYFHVLTALKNISEYNFAMKEYIVYVRPFHAISRYLNYRMRYGIDRRTFDIENSRDTIENLHGFNDSQMNAFEAALSREFTIIQGPPGTGKTFLALKIAKTLLNNNKNMWWHSPPMLVISFTNHALDQFLEGLLDTTHRIVRVGGQSKNGALSYFNLAVLRRSRRSESRKENKKYNYLDSLDRSRFSMQTALKNVHYVNFTIEEIEQYNGIVSASRFRHTVPDFDAPYLPLTDQRELRKWLIEGYEELSLKEEREAHTNETHRCLNDSMSCRCRECYEPASIITLEDMKKRINELKHSLVLLENDLDVIHGDIFFGGYPFEEIHDTKKSISTLEQQYETLNRRLTEVRAAIQNQQIRTDIDTEDLTSLNHDDRWALYTFWLNAYHQHLKQRTFVLIQHFQEKYKYYEQEQNLDDIDLFSNKRVIGMTTTSAARLRPVLERLRCSIVIVEEAAEILEAHIITALTEHCQNLILIGDHKQLKPSSADYKMTKDYNLGISLFERMVNNGIECHTLNVQHRMRPEISRLICPTIYPNLKDHESVFDRPSIAGIDSPIRFIDHRELEDDCGDNTTKTNLHEVKFAVALARYLILNGYMPEQVTILTAYLGQLFEMCKERKRFGSILRDVRIAALDNYQGEQSDIIILSLVRSNTAQDIGFLATENRVCVALSRARNGFYLIGNMELLCSKSKLWRKIKGTLEAQNAIGPDLTLRCQIHMNTTTVVTKGEDFQQVSQGGCNEICKAELICGHLCGSVCHIQNREHKDHQCLERCNEKHCDVDENHTCEKMCYEECGPCIRKVLKKLVCGHELSLACHIDVDAYECPVLVTTKLPCDHIVDRPCHVDVDTFICRVPCGILINLCGHYCMQDCHIGNDPDHVKYECKNKCDLPRVGCTMPTESTKHFCPKLCHESCPPCDIIVKKQRNKCTHINEVACHEDVDSLACMKPCMNQLSCGHQCKKKCDEPCESSSCTVKVRKVLQICGHKVATLCKEEPKRNRCNKKCPLQLPCGHSCTKRCNQVCTPRCEVMVDLKQAASSTSTSSPVQIKCCDLTADKKCCM